LAELNEEAPGNLEEKYLTDTAFAMSVFPNIKNFDRKLVESAPYMFSSSRYWKKVKVKDG